ncbi:MAG TPA: aldehyde dehydrogenase family protein [Myxococcota bacterium]|nr:aldehyde dehydrogenase family protein [Myxococcota bacterium]
MTIPVNEKEIERLVTEIVRRVTNGDSQPVAEPRPRSLICEPRAGAQNGGSTANGVFETMEEAIAAAGAAYQAFSGVSLERRRVFIKAMRQAGIEMAEDLARKTVAETGFGRAEHKVQKNLLAARKTPGVEDLTPMCYTGDDGLTLVEPAPYGVVAAVTPCTNPVATVINNGISMVAAGNAVVFNPHPLAKGVSNEAVSLLNKAIHAAGGPETLLCSIAQPSLETSQAIMMHPGIRLLMVTGGGEVVRLAMTCGKKAVAAGPGNPPVIVDDTADIRKAARCIVDGASFDNNVLCTAEKEVLVLENVADRLIDEMITYGARLISGDDVDKITSVLVEPGRPHPHPNKKFVGKDASVLLDQIGLTAGPDTRLVICRVPFEHPLVQAEMLMPILPIVAVPDLTTALAKAKQAEHGNRHSAMMHSESVSNMSLVAREIETTIFVKNAPSYAGLGFGGEGFTTLSIAGPTGEGLTSARTFTRQRRCVLAGAFRIV